MISIHALREEGDPSSISGTSGISYFNPRPPRGGRHEPRVQLSDSDLFQSTPSARRATETYPAGGGAVYISIHALREEGDPTQFVIRWTQDDFNPRPPRGGRPPTRIPASTHTYFNPRPPRGERHSYKDSSIHTYLFQSTPSARRATRSGRGADGWVLFQSTPSARRATTTSRRACAAVLISIHALREEGDRIRQTACEVVVISIHALREEGDQAIQQGIYNHIISIHALREEGDYRQHGRRSSWREISIHALREEGDCKQSSKVSTTTSFQSTPSARRATPHGCVLNVLVSISIHALREEGDICCRIRHKKDVYFNPRPPRGGRLAAAVPTAAFE